MFSRNTRKYFLNTRLKSGILVAVGMDHLYGVEVEVAVEVGLAVDVDVAVFEDDPVLVGVADVVGLLVPVELIVPVEVDVGVEDFDAVALVVVLSEFDFDTVALVVAVLVPVAVPVGDAVPVEEVVPEEVVVDVEEPVEVAVDVGEVVAVEVAVGVEVEILVATLPSRISHRYVVLATVVTDTRDRMSAASAKVATVFPATLNPLAAVTTALPPPSVSRRITRRIPALVGLVRVRVSPEPPVTISTIWRSAVAVMIPAFPGSASNLGPRYNSL
jgi:hypothetical protein